MDESLLLTQMGSRIRAIRIKNNLTQNDVADKCNFEKASISRIESGQTNLTIRSLIKLCNALGIEIIELFSE